MTDIVFARSKVSDLYIRDNWKCTPNRNLYDLTLVNLICNWLTWGNFSAYHPTFTVYNLMIVSAYEPMYV